MEVIWEILLDKKHLNNKNQFLLFLTFVLFIFAWNKVGVCDKKVHGCRKPHCTVVRMQPAHTCTNAYASIQQHTTARTDTPDSIKMMNETEGLEVDDHSVQLIIPCTGRVYQIAKAESLIPPNKESLDGLFASWTPCQLLATQVEEAGLSWNLEPNKNNAGCPYRQFCWETPKETEKPIFFFENLCCVCISPF